MGALKKKCALMCSPPRCIWFMWIKWNMCWEHGRKHSLIQVCIGQYINGTKPYQYFNEYQSSSRASKISQFIGPHQQIISNYQLTPLKPFFSPSFPLLLSCYSFQTQLSRLFFPNPFSLPSNKISSFGWFHLVKVEELNQEHWG